MTAVALSTVDGQLICRQDDVPDFEILPLGWVLEIDQGWEEQDHIPALIHDRGSAVCAADFAGKLMDAGLL